MLQSKSRTWVEIDLAKVKANTELVQKLLGKTKIMGVVKANAYGHGDVVIANLLQDLGVDFFAVSSIDEALKLRQNGITQNILILGYTPVEHFHYLLEENITQCVMSYEYAQKLADFAKKHNGSINGHIKLDTGMGRLGIQIKDDNYQIDEVKKCYKLDGLNITGIFSHFSVSDSIVDEDDKAYTDHQITLFDKALADLRASDINVGLTHMQNSYGCVNYDDLTYDYARPGIILLGNLSNDQDILKYNIDLKPSLSWKANISLVKKVTKGTNISYGRHFVADKDMKVATVSCGYADGLNRNASNKHMEVLVAGKRCEVLGNICMDQFIIDVTNVDDVAEGDIVTIVGEDNGECIQIDEQSRLANTINNESFTKISNRVPRFYINGE